MSRPEPVTNDPPPCPLPSAPQGHPLAVWASREQLSARQAASLLGVSLSHWYDLIKGRHLPGPALSRRIASRTGISRVTLASALETPERAA